VAAGVALGVTELVSGIGDAHGPSVVTAVGTRVIGVGAGSLKDVAVNVFGTNDKPALVTGIVVISLLLGALLGRATTRRPGVGVAGFGAFGMLGALIGATDVLGSTATLVTASILGAFAGAIVLRVVLLAGGRPAPAAVADTSDADADRVLREPVVVDPRVKHLGRRTFMLAASGAGAAAAIAAAGGRGLRGPSLAARSRAAATLPKAKRTVVAPAVQPFSVDGLSPYITPNSDFYLIDTAIFVPQIDAANWSLSIKGMVEHPFTVTYDELMAMDMVEEPVTLSCVSNEVGGDLVSTASWLGVPLGTLLDRAGLKPGATQIVGRSVDDFTAGFPTEKARDGRTALVAVGIEHGDEEKTGLIKQRVLAAEGDVINDQLKVVGHATKVRRRSCFFHRLPESFHRFLGARSAGAS
jgi:hypothetical protein